MQYYFAQYTTYTDKVGTSINILKSCRVIAEAVLI
jgi:hypothetical protein